MVCESRGRSLGAHKKARASKKTPISVITPALYSSKGVRSRDRLGNGPTSHSPVSLSRRPRVAAPIIGDAGIVAAVAAVMATCAAFPVHLGFSGNRRQPVLSRCSFFSLGGLRCGFWYSNFDEIL